MNWKDLTTLDQIEQIKLASASKPQVIFKHSTRCSISTMVLNRLNNASEDTSALEWHFLDLLQYRNISNAVADVFHVYHESPQILLIKNGECIYDESHMAIQVPEILKQA